MSSTSIRAARMIDSAPGYYQYAALYKYIQEAIAAEADRIEAANEDIRLQGFILTATWGLKYWEQMLGITTYEKDSYDIRRSRVLAQWRGIGNFGADMLKAICEAFSNGEVNVSIIVPDHMVIVTFIGKRGIPENLADLQALIENLVHAHLGITYKFTYLIWREVNRVNKTFAEWDAQNFTWDEVEVYKP